MIVGFGGCATKFIPEVTVVKRLAPEITAGGEVVILPVYISRKGKMTAPSKALEDSLETAIYEKAAQEDGMPAGKISYLRWKEADSISGFKKAYFPMADSVMAGAEVNNIDPMYLCRKLDAASIFFLLVADEETVFSYSRPGFPRKTTNWENEAIIEKIYHTERFTLADFRAVLAVFDYETGRLKGLFHADAKEYAAAGAELAGERVIADLCLAALDAAFSQDPDATATAIP